MEFPCDVWGNQRQGTHYADRGFSPRHGFSKNNLKPDRIFKPKTLLYKRHHVTIPSHIYCVFLKLTFYIVSIGSLIFKIFKFFFYKQPRFRVEPRVAIKIPKMRLKVAVKLLSIFGSCLTILCSNVWKKSKNWKNLRKLLRISIWKLKSEGSDTSVNLEQCWR